MLTTVSGHLLVMSIVAGGLVLLLRQSDVLSQKYLSATWRYYSHLIAYSFFLVPYFALVPLLRFSLGPVTPSGRYAAGHPYSLNAITEWSGLATWLIAWLPYLLIGGSVIFMATTLIEKRRVKSRILAACQEVSEHEILRVLDECRLKLGITKRIPIYLAPYSGTPFLYGCLRPFIVLPHHTFSRVELEYIFLHELTHLKRHDVWVKGFLLLINAFHWYNPLAYLGRERIYHLCELSCDESITRSMTHDERQKYCELILGLLLAARGRCTAKASLYAFSSGRQYLEERIHRIMERGSFMTRKSFAAGIAVALLIGSIGVIAAYAASVRLIPPSVRSPVTLAAGERATISLSAYADFATAKAFLERHALRAESVWYRATRHGFSGGFCVHGSLPASVARVIRGLEENMASTKAQLETAPADERPMLEKSIAKHKMMIEAFNSGSAKAYGLDVEAEAGRLYALQGDPMTRVVDVRPTTIPPSESQGQPRPLQPSSKER